MLLFTAYNELTGDWASDETDDITHSFPGICGFLNVLVGLSWGTIRQ